MTTIYESFWECLPELDMRVREDGVLWSIPAINPEGSTGNYDAPKALEPVPSATYCNVAITQLGGPPGYLTTQLPALEDNLYLRSEGDVVRAVNLYLIHPINMALQAIGSSIFCQSEWHDGQTARTDIIWKWKNGTKWVTLGVLELKNTHLLNKVDFVRGLADMQPGTRSRRDPATLIRLAYAETRSDNSFLGQSVSRVSRQARKYHETSQTDFVAVFDWCSMIVFDFGDMDEGNDRLAKGTWHEELNGQTQYGTFRMLLLGMLITSMQRTLANP